MGDEIDVMSVCDTVDFYQNMNLTLDDATNIIKSNFNQAARSFVAAGYQLKKIRDSKLYLEKNYSSMTSFAQFELGMNKTYLSRLIAINDRFSVGGNSPVIADEYKNFGKSQLVEMLNLSEEQITLVSPDNTTKVIRRIAQNNKNIEPRLRKAINVYSEKDKDELFHKAFEIDSVKELFTEINMNIINDPANQSLFDEVLSRKKNHTKNGSYIERSENSGYILGDTERHTVFAVSELFNLYKELIYPRVSERNYEPEQTKTESKQLYPKVCKYDGKSNCVAICNTGADCCAECSNHGCCNGECGWQEERIPKHSGQCLYRPEYPCTLPETSKLAKGDGINCNAKCCWNCSKHGDCGYECNSSHHRPVVTETVETVPKYLESVIKTVENVIEESDETVEAEVTEMLSTETTSPDEPIPSHLELAKELLKQKQERLYSFNRVQANTYADRKYIESRKVEVGALAAYICDLDETEPVKQVQPELPKLKNNDQRKEFIDQYKTWPIWIDQPLTGERYYRYNLSDKVAMVVKVSKKHVHENYKETKAIEYGAEQYYLLGVKYEYGLKGSTFKEDKSRTFYECCTNKSALVDYLKEFQKGQVN